MKIRLLPLMIVAWIVLIYAVIAGPVWLLGIALAVIAIERLWIGVQIFIARRAMNTLVNTAAKDLAEMLRNMGGKA